MDDLEVITVIGIDRYDGSVVVFVGSDEADNIVRFAVDHRPGLALAAAVCEGEEPQVGLEGWEILSRRPRD